MCETRLFASSRNLRSLLAVLSSLILILSITSISTVPHNTFFINRNIDARYTTSFPNNSTFSQDNDNNAYAAYSKAAPSPLGPTINDANLTAELLVKGLKRPTSMAFLGPNDILVLEKETGLVKRILNGKLLPTPLLDVPVASDIERGLLGIAISQNKSLDGQRYVFLYYTESGGGQDGDDLTAGVSPAGNRLYRYELTNDNGKLVNPKLLLDLPAIPENQRGEHNGGKVLIGPDGNVYLVIGEVGGHRTQAQNNESGPNADGTGGILRVTQDGNAVSNSILGKKPPLNVYYAYGIRNSFGMDFDPVTGTLWDTENGPTSGDEINLVQPGFNSGWSKIEGYAKDAILGKINPSTDLVKLGKKAKYHDPEFVWAITVGPTALKFLNSNKLGAEYHNDMFVGDIDNGYIYHFKLDVGRTELLAPTGENLVNKAVTPQKLPTLIFGQGFGGVTDLQVGPDGYLYVLTFPGSIYRIVPTSVAKPALSATSTPKPSASTNSTNSTNVEVGKNIYIMGVKGTKSYSPGRLTIGVGDTVTWTNSDVIAHTVTSGKDGDPDEGTVFNSGSMLTTNRFSHKFNDKGVFDYFCIYHPTMVGRIIVK
jgi:glucose/arabinose dehydrogenase/plastocyanin